MTIDTKFNGVVRNAHDSISAMGSTVNKAELSNLYGFACGYVQALYDTKAIPKPAFDNLKELATSTHNQAAERNGWLSLD
nr:hypothetical protein [uncultured Pseudogulbenkiania sp.]